MAKHNHVFYNKTTEQITEWVHSNASRLYELFVSVTEIKINSVGKYTHVTVEYEQHNPYYSGN